MTQADKARAFADLHKPGEPLVLYNIWDAGGAKAIAKAGAQAIATGSWSVAAAHGYADGEAIPLDFVLQIVSRIATTVDLPVTVDFEGAYAEVPEGVAANVTRIIEVGAVGINFEDQKVGGTGLYGLNAQCERLSSIVQAAHNSDLPLFLNARTDLFLQESDRGKHADLIAQTKERATAYTAAGASGFFVPGLVDASLIADVCETTSIPVNVMMMDGAPTAKELAACGVARISYGPGPYFKAVADLKDRYRESMVSL